MSIHLAPRTRARLSLWAVVAILSAAGYAACSSDANPEPNPSFTTSSGPGSTTTSTGGGGPGTGGSAGGNGGTGGAAGSGGAPGTGGGGGDCDGPAGCYNCPPHSSDQFLNHCTDAQCAYFDNEVRLPLYNGGDLPPLP